MKTKQIPFSLEMVKKIQAGEVKGVIKTREGKAARFIGERIHDTYPLIFTYTPDKYGMEKISSHTIKGLYQTDGTFPSRDIIIEIETNVKEFQFKPFDKVLVRDEDSELWRIDFFSHYIKDFHFKYQCVGNMYAQCIPYTGNENLVGTTDKPKEDLL